MVYVVGMVILKNFKDLKFLLCKVRYVPKLWKNLLFISMFYDLSCCTRVEHEVLKFAQDGLIMTKGSKICRLYVLDNSPAIEHVSSSSQDFLNKNKL